MPTCEESWSVRTVRTYQSCATRWSHTAVEDTNDPPNHSR